MRTKKSSRTYLKAIQRLAGLKSIEPALDLGNDLSIAAYEQKIQAFEQAMSEYNTLLSMIDALLQQVRVKEKNLAAISSRWLGVVGGHFGKDSEEYQKAGGVRTSLRKRPRRNLSLARKAELPMAASLQTA
ncbi:MAG: hypothetical protein KDC70_12190 [Saprospiraceae bacterium]|nr:hypothetical protein [Saprospiraceae bacterium]